MQEVFLFLWPFKEYNSYSLGIALLSFCIIKCEIFHIVFSGDKTINHKSKKLFSVYITFIHRLLMLYWKLAAISTHLMSALYVHYRAEFIAYPWCTAANKIEQRLNMKAARCLRHLCLCCGRFYIWFVYKVMKNHCNACVKKINTYAIG